MSNRKNTKSAGNGPNQTMLRRTLFMLIVCGIVAFIVLGARLYQIQIIRHEEYESAAIRQQVRETTVSASRGTIYDRNGKILAMSASVENVYISPREIEMYEEDPILIASGLSEILGVDFQWVLGLTSDSSSWYKTIALKVEDDVAAQVRAFKNQYNLKGVRLEPSTKRYYPYGSLAAHVVGFVGTDNYGLAGIESRYDDELSGTAGRTVRSTTAAGTEMLYTNFEDLYDAEDGYDATLTLDAAIQYYMTKHLEQAVEDYQIRDGAAALCMNVNTGELLGMVSLGDFDLNHYQIISDEAKALIEETSHNEEEYNSLYAQQQLLQWSNKALSDTYEPGSTFKIITLAMGLNEGVINENSSFYCGGSVDVLGRLEPVNCWKLPGHGPQTLTNAVQHSCNVAFVNIGQLVGAQKFYEYAEAFGFINRSTNKDVMLSAKTGIDLAGESGSIWWSENQFTKVQDRSQLAAASFGQTFTITPLQLITAVSACVNGGNLMQPYVVKEIVDSEGNTVTANEPTVVRKVISEETSAMIRKMLEAVVGDPKEGTGRNAYVAGYRIGGKTGTSTDTTREVGEDKKYYIVSFLGVAPADDPEIAILVLLDNPAPQSETGIYVSGGQMAAPVVGKMMADILPYLGVEAEYSESEAQNMDKTVPSAKLLTLDQAQQSLAAAGLTWRVIGEGSIVTAQLPAANSVIASGSEVILYADAEPSEDLEEMIDLKDLPYDIARQRLAYYGLFISTSSSVIDPYTQLITAQSIPVGTMVEHGTIVDVTLVSTSDDMLGQY